MTVPEYMQHLGTQARAASQMLARTTTAIKNQALATIAQQLEQHRSTLLSANAKDVAAGQAQNLDPAFLDRLTLKDSTIDSMIKGLTEIIALPDPIGTISDLHYRPAGFQVGKMRVPLGVVGIIYESRPNVTIDAAALCLKSGNASILRGGSESIHSNQAIAQCIEAGLTATGIPATAVQVVETTDRAAVGELIRMSKYVDVIIPRGGKGLIERISQEAKIPVIKHLFVMCTLTTKRTWKKRWRWLTMRKLSAMVLVTPWKHY